MVTHRTGESDLNSKVAILPKLILFFFTIINNLGPGKADLEGELTVIVR